MLFVRRYRDMKRIKSRLVARLLGILLLLVSASLIFSNAVGAQMQPWIQQEQMRQMYEQQAWLQQERARQAARPSTVAAVAAAGTSETNE